MIINTYRFVSHSKSDDGRDQNEVVKWKANDPLKIAESELDAKTIEDVQNEVKQYISDETNKAILADPAEWNLCNQLMNL